MVQLLTAFLHTACRNLQLTFRSLRRNPGFTLVVVLSLALGIGANTAIFSAVDGILLRPLPVPDPGGLVRIDIAASHLTQFGNASYLDWVDFRNRSQSFANLAIATEISVGMNSGAGEPQVVYGELVSGNFFSTMQVHPALGRDFRPEEDQTPGKYPVAIISDGLWRRAFANNPSAVGREIKFNGRSFTIIGIAPESFTGPNLYYRPDVYVPVMMGEGLTTDGNAALIHREWRQFNMFGRLKSGVSVSQAQAEMNVIMRNLEKTYPDTNRDTVAIVRTEMVRRFAQGYLFPAVIMGLVVLVLLIACANVASLLMARATSRMKEITTRFAIGATRRILIRQLLTESTVLAALGGICGVLIGEVSIRGISAVLPFQSAPEGPQFHLDLRVLTFALAASVLSVFLCGLAPAFSATREAMSRASINVRAGSGKGRSYGATARRILITAQIALSTVLLIGGGLLLKAFLQAEKLDLGFNPNNVQLVTTDPSMRGYSNEKSLPFQQEFANQVANIPGVRSASVASSVPFLSGSSWDLEIDGYTAPGGEQFIDTATNQVGPGYFATIKIPLLRGREFNQQDGPGAPVVAIVNEALVRRYIAKHGDLEQAIGHKLALRDHAGIRIVGVVRDSNYGDIAGPFPPIFYLPYAQMGRPSATLHVRTEADPKSLFAQIRDVLKKLDPEVAPVGVTTLTAAVSSQGLFVPRVSAILGGAFGAVALFLALIGTYGVVSFLVARQSQEIGVRIALGAERSDILRMVLSNAVFMAFTGLAIGAFSALLLAPLLSRMLIGVQPRDPQVFLIITLALIAATAGASYIPARRATKVDPMVALRYE